MAKLRPEVLQRYIFRRVGVRDPDVLLGPSIGEDAAAIDIGGGRVLVVHTDPITGAIENLGWLSVHVASNDVAVMGAKPRWLTITLLLPPGLSDELLDRVTAQIDSAAKELGAMVVGGHSEYAPGLDRAIAVATAMGVVEKELLVRTGGASVGDLVVMTKSAGIEGTAILAHDFADELIRRGVARSVIASARSFLKMISVVREALALSRARVVTSMHDPTEGGVLGGVAEVAYASGNTIVIYEDRVRIAPETLELCRAMNLDPLRLISSGTLIATVPRSGIERAINALRGVGVEVSVIGEVQEYRGYLVELHRRDGAVERISDVYVEDELMKLWEGGG